MAVLEQKITIEDSCSIVKKAKSPFSPIKEAITNAMDSIVKRQESGISFIPKISVILNFIEKKDLYNPENSKYLLSSISIVDNGEGFIQKNIERFKNLGERSKGLNNRGTGKVQLFCRFKQIDIESIFYEDNKWKKFTSTWKRNGDYTDSISYIGKENDNKTTVMMSYLINDKEHEYYGEYLKDIENLKRDILKNFLLRLWLGSSSTNQSIEIKTMINEHEKDSFIYNEKTIPVPDKEDTIKIHTQKADIYKDTKGKIKVTWLSTEPSYTLNFYRFKLNASEINENGVYICSKNIVVEPFSFSAVKKTANFDGARYISCVSGNLLDASDNVSQSVESFNFPLKREVEKDLKEETGELFNQENIFVFWDEIKEKINLVLEKNYSDIQGLKESREKDILKIAARYGISSDIVDEADIEFNDTEEKTIEKLFQAQARKFAKENIEIRHTYEELNNLELQNLDPTSNDYKDKFRAVSQKLLQKIPQQNKDELTRYIIRRDMVVKLLGLALKNELAIQKDWKDKKARGIDVKRQKEAIFHDLIFRRKMKGMPNDLWILNEEFVHFDGYSDIELENLVVNGEKLLQDNIDIYEALKSVGIEKDTYLKQRPDIFLFPEEGKCILIEFKAPDVDLSEHTNQISRYATLIANYSRRPKQFTQFFGFLIGEEIDLVNLDRSLWKKVPFGNYRIYPNKEILSIGEVETTIANIYQEIIPFSEIAKRAKIRNKSFAEKLGIEESELEKIQNLNNIL